MVRKHKDNFYSGPSPYQSPYNTHYLCRVHGYIPKEECLDSTTGWLCPICFAGDELSPPKKRRVLTTPRWRKLKSYEPSEVRKVPLTDEEVMQLVSMGQR